MRGRARARHQILNEVHTPASRAVACGVMRGLIEVEAPDSVRVGAPKNAGESARSRGRSPLDCAGESEEWAGRIRRSRSEALRFLTRSRCSRRRDPGTGVRKGRILRAKGAGATCVSEEIESLGRGGCADSIRADQQRLQTTGVGVLESVQCEGRRLDRTGRPVTMILDGFGPAGPKSLRLMVPAGIVMPAVLQ